jgi:hypothetical protein
VNAEQIQEGAGVTFVWRADMVEGQGESSLSEEEVIRVAEWARKEALREAAEVVEDSDPDCFHAFGMGGHDDSCGRRAALYGIRALAEGEQR